MSWSIANHRSLAPFFSTIVAWGGGLGGHDDRQAASRTPHTTSKANPLRRGLGFKGVGVTLPRTAGIFVFGV